jgi:membrane-associated phospholipid phosphatase
MSPETEKDLSLLPSKITSVIFHPLFMPVYGMIIIFLPSAPYGYLPFGVKRLLILIIAVNNVLLPLSLLPVLRRMNLISSFTLDVKKERNMPLIITTVLYATTSYIFLKFPIPFFVKSFIFSVFFLSLVITLINFKWMISVHASGAGALIGLMLILCFRMYAPLEEYLILSVIAAGFILSSRLRLNVHNPRQVWYGFFTGFSGMIVLYLLFQKIV